MKLLCPDCGRPIPAADTNIDTGIAKCTACGAVVNIFQALGLPAPGTTSLAAAPAPREMILPRPPRMVVDDRGPDGWCARWRWFSPKYIFLTFFCVCWDGFLVFWYAMALSHRGPGQNMAVLFPLLHVAVGAGLTYTVIAGYLNHTWVTLTTRQLTIRHGPVPWIGNHTLDIDVIEQLYCKRGKVQKDGNHTYELWAALKGGDAKALLTLDAADAVRFLEQQLEAKLGLPAQAVPGEYRGD